MQQTVELADDAAYIGCEILCFGRTASGERFTSGQVLQHNRIRRGGRWLWYEQGGLQAGSAGQHSRFGLAGHSVCATLIAVAPDGAGAWPPGLIDQLRQALAALPGVAGQFGVSQKKPLLVVRLLCDASELARSAMLEAWALLRPHLMQRELVVPRIWQT